MTSAAGSDRFEYYLTKTTGSRSEETRYFIGTLFKPKAETRFREFNFFLFFSLSSFRHHHDFISRAKERAVPDTNYRFPPTSSSDSKRSFISSSLINMSFGSVCGLSDFWDAVKSIRPPRRGLLSL